VGGAAMVWWRTLSHRWLFAVAGLLALVGLQFLIREVFVTIHASTFIASPTDSTVAAIRAEDAVSLAENAIGQLTVLMFWMLLSLMMSGVVFLWWLRNALWRPWQPASTGQAPRED
jgi:hypothetical protein